MSVCVCVCSSACVGVLAVYADKAGRAERVSNRCLQD